MTFSYPGAERPAMCNVNLTIKAGETLAIVGPNGSGKTTMSSLLLRFYDPASGKILLDGVDIHKASLRSLRRQIGLVTQETIIFTDTIRNNIAYADPKASDEQVYAAAKAAHADDFIAKVRSDLGGTETDRLRRHRQQPHPLRRPEAAASPSPARSSTTPLS